MTSLSDHVPQRSPRDYFWKMKLILRFLGVSFSGEEGTAYNIYSLLVFVPFVVTYMILDASLLFKADTDDDNSLMMFFFAFSLGTIKGIYMKINRRRIGKLLDSFEQEPFTPNLDRGGTLEQKLIEKCVWITNFQIYVYLGCGILSILFDSSVTLSKRIQSDDYHDWDFPYGKFAVLNVTYSPNYEICWVYQMISTVAIAGLFMTADLIIAAVLAHISLQFRMLQNTIRQLPRVGYNEMMKIIGSHSSFASNIESDTIPWKYLKATVVRAVNYHVAITTIAEEVESLFKYLILFTYLATLATICFLLYHASKVPITDPRVMGAIGAVTTACGQTLLLCYWGEQITFQSEEVGRAAFETNYVNTDVTFQKALALIIRRSQNPTSVSAGNFAVIGLPTFLWIIRTSYSSFMMLRRLQS